MKHFLALILTALVLSLPAHAGLGASVQWDVRTTGNDTFGGGFDNSTAGTDQSQGSSAAVTIDNSAIHATVNASTITFVSGYTPTSADVGNIVNIISSTGGTPPTFKRYQISSQTPTTWVLDSTTGAVTATITSAKMGGSLLTIAKGLSLMVANSGSSFNTVWVQAGTYTLTTGLAAPSSTGALLGYTSSHGDGGKATITTATNTTILITNSANIGFLYGNFTLSNTAGTRAVCLSVGSGPVVATNMIFDGCTNGVKLTGSFSAFNATSVEVKNSTGAGILQAVAGSPLSLVGCYIHGNTGAGISDAGGSAAMWTIASSIFSTNGGGGILMASNTGVLTGQSLDISGNTGPGVSATGSNPGVYVYNSVLYNNSTYGISITNAAPTAANIGLTNAYGANGTAPRLNFPVESGAITLTANPFTSSTNFALNSTAGGGALLKAVGYPHAFIGGLTTGFIDVGAVQTQASAASVTVGYGSGQ